MAKSSNIFELKNKPHWFVRIVILIVLVFVFSLLAIIATGLWGKLGIAMILFFVALIITYGIYFFSSIIVKGTII